MDLGIPNFDPRSLPFTAPGEADSYALAVEGQELTIGAVSLGNPHAVLTVPAVDSAPVATLGAAIERHPRFPRRVNAGFLQIVARGTPGFSGADLANLANEAALLAARRNHDKVEMADFTDSLEKIMLGAPRGTVLSPEDRERTAYHESGHALVGMLTPDADPVRKISIIPRGMALGVTLSSTARSPPAPNRTSSS